jgi:hypothetical protein
MKNQPPAVVAPPAARNPIIFGRCLTVGCFVWMAENMFSSPGRSFPLFYNSELIHFCQTGLMVFTNLKFGCLL